MHPANQMSKESCCNTHSTSQAYFKDQCTVHIIVLFALVLALALAINNSEMAHWIA